MVDNLIHVDLTGDERDLLTFGLNEYLGPAAGAPILAPLVGARNTQEFFELLNRLMSAIETRQALSELDWIRALLLTEISWASDILGAASEIQTTIRDERALPLLRSLQRKLVTGERIGLLTLNADNR